jgi:hypothetical protein
MLEEFLEAFYTPSVSRQKDGEEVSNNELEELVIDLEVAMQLVLRQHGIVVDNAMERSLTILANTVADLADRDVLEASLN